jgi:Holliday junction resolvase RusA-like endonuclease
MPPFRSPWELWQPEQFKRPVGEYDIKIWTQAKERHGRTLNTRSWQDTVFEATEEQAPRILPVGRLGLQVLFLSTKPTGDLSNALKALEDALNRRAYHDDASVDYIETMRVYGPDIPNRILVRVREQQ